MHYFRIPENVLTAISKYLASKPYNEVAVLIDALKGLNVIEEQKEQKKPQNDNKSKKESN